MIPAAANRAGAAHTVAPGGDLIHVMVCDDSVVIRGALSRMLESDPGIRVVARVGNGQMAVDALRHQRMDVVVLDIEMPVMDGLTALPLLLRADPGLRVIMASTLTTRGADIALRALRLGAADYLPKPEAQGIGAEAFRTELLAKVRGLARLRGPARGHAPGYVPAPGHTQSRAQGHATSAAVPACRPVGRPPQLVAIGGSTGGPQALFTLVQGLAAGGVELDVPVVLTQHTPPAFAAMLAGHITGLGGPLCVEAQDGQPLQPGRLHLAPGDRHLLVERRGGALIARLSDGPPENYCRPAVDPMLRSAAEACGGRVLVVMLTGMGHDGLEGTRAVVEAGGTAVAQDEASSVVWGMPGAVARAGLCHAVLPLSQIAPKILNLVQTGKR